MATINKIDNFTLGGNNYLLADRQVLNRSELGVLEQAVTIGDTSYKTDPRVSSWVMGDFTGGIGIEDITGADTTRYRWGTADARSPYNITLGPLVTQTRPTADDADTWYPFGDVPGTDEEFYCAVLESAGVVNLYAWDETNDTWRASSGDIDAIPLEVPPAGFCGTGANSHLWQHRNDAAIGPIGVRTTAAGVVATTAPGATYSGYSFAVWDNKLWIIGANRRLYSSFDGTTFTAITNPATGSDLLLEPSEIPWQLISWWNLAGESTLYCVTTRSLWAYNGLKGNWEFVYAIPPHPISYRQMTVWRPTEDLWVGMGGSIIKRTPAGVTVLLAGPGADGDGLPSGFFGAVRGMAPEFNGLYVALFATPAATQKASLLVYTGTGWHPIWEASAASSTRFIKGPYVSQASSQGRIWWGYDSYGYTVELRGSPYSPRQGFTAGIDKFAASSYLETPRFWAQTMGLSKVALALEVFMENATSTETLTVQYQTDVVTAWTTLGSAIVTGRNNGTYMTRIRFGTAVGGVYPGITFNWIKFKFTFARGSTVTNTPIMNAAVLHFVKQRDNTPGFQLVVDTTQTVDGRTPDTQRAELRAMLEGTASGGPIYSLKYADHVLGVIVTGMASEEASGSDERGLVTLSLLAVQVVS